MPYVVALLPYTYQRIRSTPARAALVAWAAIALIGGIASNGH